MKKRILIPILALIIVFQLAVPLAMIAEKYDISQNGDEFKFRVSAYAVGKKIKFNLIDIDVFEITANSEYGVITVGEDGFAHISRMTSDKPSEPYVKSDVKGNFVFPIDYFKLNSRAYEALFHRINEAGSTVYIKVKVKDGKAVLENMYINDMTVTQYLNMQ